MQEIPHPVIPIAIGTGFGMTIYYFTGVGKEVAIRKLYFILFRYFSANRHFFPPTPQSHLVIPSASEESPALLTIYL